MQLVVCLLNASPRTNPVTGWKSAFICPPVAKRIIGVTKDESDIILKYLDNLVKLNHDLQVRFKWEKVRHQICVVCDNNIVIAEFCGNLGQQVCISHSNV